jgi:hypothetical protein
MNRLRAIFTVIFFTISIGVSYAQVSSLAAKEAALVSDDVSLHVRLNPIQTIEVSASQRIVNIDYVTRADYQQGVSNTQGNHITIYSTGGFIVSVNSLEDYIKNNYSISSGSKEMIPALGITVMASDGSNPLVGALYSANVPLSKEGAVLFSKLTGGVDKNFSITYTAENLDAYVNKQVNGEVETIYNTTVVYTIASQ